MAEQAYAYVTLIPVAKGFQSSIAKELAGVDGIGSNAGGKAGQGFGNSFGMSVKKLIGPALAAVSVTAISSFAKSAVGAASAFSAEFEGVNQTFGEAAKSVQAFADQAAYSAGISETAALQAAKNFGGFASAAGLAGQDAATFSTSLVQAAGDLASFNDVPVEQALAAIQSGLAGQSEPLRNFRIFLDQATLSAQAAKMGFDGTFSTLSQGEQTMVRQAAIMEQMGVQAGDFEKYAGTYGNALKTVQAEFQNMTAELGQALIPALEQLLPAFLPIIEQVGPILLNLFEALAPIIQTLTENIGPLFEALAPLFDALNLIISALGPIVEQLIPIFIDLIGMVTPIILQLVEAFLPLVVKMLPSFMGLLEALMPILELVGDFLSTLVVPALQLLGDVVSNVLIGAIQILTGAFETLRSILQPVWDFLKPIIEGLLALAGIKPSALKKEVVVSYKQINAPAAFGLPGQTSIAPSVIGSTIPKTLGTASASGKAKADAKKQVKGVIQSTKKALIEARKEYNKAVDKANAQFAEREGEIYENYNIAVARATIQRDADLAQALKDNTKRVSEINADFAKRLDDIVKQSMNRLRDAYKSAVELNVADIFNSDVVAGSIDGTIEMMRQKLAASRQLLANAAALSAAGFSQTFIEQVVGAGTEVGNELASSILNATPEQRAEMQNLFGAIEKEASSGMDSLAKTIYEKNGLATEELRNLYAQTQNELVIALAEQEATYQQTMADIMARFNEAIAEAATTRDAALLEAKDALDKALLEASNAWLADLEKVDKAYKEKIASMKAAAKSMSSEVSALDNSIATAKAIASFEAAPTTGGIKGFQRIVRPMAEGGLVTGPLNALVGEAGPEVVIPLDRFESMIGMTQGSGKALNYYAAPNQSLDSEQELFTAMKRAKVVVGW